MGRRIDLLSHIFDIVAAEEGQEYHKKKGKIMMKDFQMLSWGQAEEIMQKNDVLVIDLREKELYEKSHIRGAISLPYEEELDIREIPYGRDIILYCDRGSASLIVGRRLAKAGYRAASVVGGFLAYRGKMLSCNFRANIVE